MISCNVYFTHVLPRPVVLFESEHFLSLVVAPMDNFKTAVHHVRDENDSAVATWDTGVSSELHTLPPGFEHRTMLVAGRGITAALDAWGRALRTAYGTDRSMVEADRAVNYLSYWTDSAPRLLPPA